MVGLVIGQLLPWLLGAALIALLWRGRQPHVAIVVGYGYAVGALLLALWMRALSFADIGWSWLSVGAPMLAGMVVAWWRLSPARRSMFRFSRPDVSGSAAIGLSQRACAIAWWLLVGVAALHLLLAAMEIVWRPVFPWDAWTQWATKARVWYEMRDMVPFAEASKWFLGGSWIDAAPGYPANLPLLQAWACITLGQWDDSLMDIPSLCFAIALVFAIYGQLRDCGTGAVLSAAGAYATISLPLLDTHVALAGYADLPLAVFVGLAAIALWRWAETRESGQLALAIAIAIACPLTKHPGWAWIAVMLSAVVVAMMPRRGVLFLCAAAAGGIVGLGVLGHTDFTIGGYKLGTFSPVWEPLWQNYFEFANWHLLWYLLPVLMILQARDLLSPPIVAGTAMVGCGLALLFVVFSFSNASAWVADYSTVNRATLHLAPLMIFYLIRLARIALDEGHVRAASIGTAASSSSP